MSSSTGKATGKKKSPGKSPAKAPANSSDSRNPAAKSDLEMLREKEITGIILVAVALLLLVNLILAPDPETVEAAGAVESVSVGVVSLFINRALQFCAGRGAFVLPVFMLVYGILVCVDKNRSSHSRLTGLLLVFCAFLGFLHLGEELLPLTDYLPAAAAGIGGGVIGALLDFVFLKIVGRVGAIILFTALVLIGVLLFFQTTLGSIFGRLGHVREVLDSAHPEQAASDGSRRSRRQGKEGAPVLAEAPLVGSPAEAPALAEETPREKELLLPSFPKEKAGKGRKALQRVKIFGLEQEANPAPTVTPAVSASAAAQPEPAAPAAEEAAPQPEEKPERSGIVPPLTPFVQDFMPSISGVSLPKAGESTLAAQPAPKAEEQTWPKAVPLTPYVEKAAPPIFGLEDEAEEAASESGSFEEKREEQSPDAEPEAPQDAAPAAALATDHSPKAGKQDAGSSSGSGQSLPPAPGDPNAPPAGSGEYKLPPVELIDAGLKVKNPRMNKVITDSIGVLESTLESFGVRATVTQVVAGPAVTRYELQPAPGVKVSRITSLSDDIALTLAAQSVRIEAPIPGKSAIGIEVSRKEVDTVYFREMIESENFRKSDKLLSFVLGKNIAGECVVSDLGKMPHLLIAGTTGSGKSVCVNTLICSILYKARPDQVKMMLIDPKKVEMMQYANLPHLIAPVVNDSKKAANALKWVVSEMDARYSLFVGSMVKDFEGYNKAHPEAPMPHIVVIIDELADLMLVARHDVEDSICRIAQMARAAGIHLVVATQRPSVDVITGLIKSNIPSRIAFAVASFTDSRTILDMGGAEKLVGKGDMLFAPAGINKPMRIQGSYVDPADVNRLVSYCAAQASPSFSQAAVEAASKAEKAAAERDEGEDELLYDAGSLIISSGQASVSYLQRRLAIGNPRAARLMDMLEGKGVVGCSNGSKPREILMSMQEFEELFA